jgi:predicted signal transduction protein with EAL and GGDEF domain
MGGDEFLILLDDLKIPGEACGIAERLLNNLAPAHQIFGSEVHATASVGIVTSDVCATSAEEIVRNADVAMYEAKRAGRACSVVFNEAMHVRLTRHAMIETSLRRAIGTPELFLVYQPIIELSSGRMVSVEALARWHHPILGAVPPSEFIPIAEGSGLIVAIGEWVLTEACQAMRSWLKQNPLRAPETVSVNVSRAELALGARLIERLHSTLRDVGLPAERLQLEVTEREVMRNPKASLEALHGLRSLGVKLAMDDFGTGTSSLAFLSEYPFDTIKIDRSFLKHLTTSRDVLAVIHATVNLVGNLDMVCVAEGVEESSHVAVLQSLGCHCGQGYLFSRPVTAEQLLNALESRKEWRPALG